MTNGWFADGDDGPGWYCVWCPAVPGRAALSADADADAEPRPYGDDHEEDCRRPDGHDGPCFNTLSLRGDGEAALTRDFYRCPNTGEWVYRWCDERLALKAEDVADAEPSRAGAMDCGHDSINYSYVLGHCRACDIEHAEPSRAEGDEHRVTLEEIDRQRERGWPDLHPEDYCHRCGAPNPSWSVDSDRFNAAMGDPGSHRWEGIVCVGCFVRLHEAATGLTCTWRLVPETPFRRAEGGRPRKADPQGSGSVAGRWQAHAAHLTNRVRELEAALRPFAEFLDALDVHGGYDPPDGWLVRIGSDPPVTLPIEALHRARAALGKANR